MLNCTVSSLFSSIIAKMLHVLALITTVMRTSLVTVSLFAPAGSVVNQTLLRCLEGKGAFSLQRHCFLLANIILAKTVLQECFMTVKIIRFLTLVGVGSLIVNDSSLHKTQ